MMLDGKRVAFLVVSLTVGLISISLIIATIAIHSQNATTHTDPGRDSQVNGTFGQNVEVSFDPERGVEILIHDNAGKVLFKSLLNLYKGIKSGQKIKICELDVFDERYDFLGQLVEQVGLCFELEGKAKFQTHPMLNDEQDVDCQSFSLEALDCREEKFEFCFNMSEAHWYGASQVKEQLWPIDKWTRPSQPFINGDSYMDEYGGVMHRYFLSSDGQAITVEWDVPLWVAFNETGSRQLCLKGSYKDSPYNNFDNTPLYFNYTQCKGTDVKHIHQFMIRKYVGTPSGVPDKDLFRYPIWSTWAKYNKDINQSAVMEFAQNIVDYNFSHAQLEIDDKWEEEYGKLDFDAEKFPRPAAMVRDLVKLGFRTTLWVHPFIEVHSEKLFDSASSLQLVRDPGGKLPALVKWWNGVGGILDFTNNRTISQFGNQLRYLQNKYNISSFKFEAGETNWLPAAYKLKTPSRNPSRFSNRYARAAYEVDPTQKNLIVRIGARTQHLPIFVRMMDKTSTWGYNMGLKSLIPTVLTFGIIGYPFVLPDVIGGTSYDEMNPDRELYIRWMEANVFLPGMQFSIPPWDFDNEVVEICRSMLLLHERYADVMINLAHDAKDTGDPIIRPLWWIDGNDEESLINDSEFLVGNNILVAPVLEQGARSRDIYLPFGVWTDKLRGGEIKGRIWLYNYTVELHELAYFIKQGE